MIGETATRGDSWYRRPSWYDILHAPGTAEEAAPLEPAAENLLPARRARRAVFLEPACGTGRFLRLLARRGRAVVGFDREPVMVEYARGALGRGRAAAAPSGVFEADMTAFELPRSAPGRGRADLAFNLINTVRHLPDDRSMLAHFERVASALGPGGVYVVGLSLQDPAGESASEDVWTGARGRCRVVQAVQYLPPEGRSRRERVISHLAVTTPSGTDHLDETYDLRTYTPRQWLALLERSALRPAALLDEGGRPIPGGAESPRPVYGLWALAPR